MRYYLTLIVFVAFIGAWGFEGAESLKAIELEPSQGEKERLEVEKLTFEVRELKEEFTKRSKIEPLVPIIVPSVTLLGFIIGAVVTIIIEGKRRRLEVVTNLKKELASENQAVRISAVHALADYQKEGISTLIACLGSRNTAFTSAVKDSLRQIGKKAVYPLRDELLRIQCETMEALKQDERTKKIYSHLPPIFFEPDKWPAYEWSEAVGNELKEISKRENLNLGSEEIRSVMGILEDTLAPSLRFSRYEVMLAHKNGREVLAYIIRNHRINHLKLPGIYLSGADLRKTNLLRANLAGANLFGSNLDGANLSGACLAQVNLVNANLVEANLSRAFLLGANLSGANLNGANLSGAFLRGANLSNAKLTMLFSVNLSGSYSISANLSGADLKGANLSGAALSGANLSGAKLWNATLIDLKGFKDVKDFKGTVLKGVAGLSREDLEYAKSKGAIIDEPTVKEATTETQKQG